MANDRHSEGEVKDTVEKSYGWRAVGLLVLTVILTVLSLLAGFIVGGMAGSVGAFFATFGIGLVCALVSLTAASINFLKWLGKSD